MKKHGIVFILVLFGLLGSIYSVVTPIMEASDELWHYPMVKYIADNWSLPYQDPAAPETPWRQEGSQAPLYYFLNAVLTCWIDTSDLPLARYANPHADSGVIKEDGNANLMIHGLVDRWPWRGTALAIHLIRFASVLMGAGTVYLTFRLVLEVWPQRVALALAAAAITAFNPMFCFISGSVNNGNLGMLLSACAIWLLVKLVKRHGETPPQSLPQGGGKGGLSGEWACPESAVPGGDRSQHRGHSAHPAPLSALLRRGGSTAWWRDVSGLGIVLGLAVLTRTNAMGLLPLTALAIGYVAWRRRSWAPFISGGFVTAGLVALVSGWWFVRNALLYDGDWTGIERFIVILGYRDPPATLRQLWGERHGFMMAYWGLFGGVNVPMPVWIYAILNWSVVAAGVGLAVAAVKKAVHWIRSPGWKRRAPASKIRSFSRRSTPHLKRSSVGMQLLLVFLWPALVVVLWAAWATRTWSSQGRLVFGAISAWSAWLAVGLRELGSWGRLRRWAGWLPGLLGAFMLVVTAWAPFGVIAPTYRPPILPSGVEPQPQHILRADMGGQLRLLGYDIENTFARPGQAFRFTLYWEAQRDMDRDWSIFCHVFDLDLGLPVATRDRFPGQGLLATSQMIPGLRWADVYVVELPETAYAPAEALLEIGLYDRATGERPPIQVEAGEAAEIVENGLRFQPLHIEPRPGALPNPVRVNFQDEIALVGWELAQRVVSPGEVVHLTLYWDALALMDSTYTVSVQVLDANWNKVAQWDSLPGDTDTSSWQIGQRVVDQRALEVAPDAPPGGYELRLLVYDGQSLERMRIVNVEGRILPNDFHVLGQIRIR